MSERDAEAFEYYDDPRHREPAEGSPRRRRVRALTEHVPVRFPASTIATLRGLAEADGMTVSAWVRHAIEQEITRRGAAEQGTTDTRRAVERLQQDIAELAAALDRAGSR
jgi:hypothetical protein